MSIHQVVAPANQDDSSLRALPQRVYRALFRSPAIPRTELDRSQSVSANFFFHIHSAKVQERTLKFRTTMGLGLLSLFTFAILVVTGVLLMFYYVPAPEQAYQRMLDLRGAVVFGGFLRALHRWSAHAMVALVLLHLCRVFLTGAHKAPREFNWVIGVFLLLITLFLSFTGYLLPWDQLAYWAITVGTSIASYAPVVGQQIRFMLLGDDAVGREALLRFYVLHVAVLPGLLTTLVGVHFWRIRKDGGLARPRLPPPEVFVPGTKPVAQSPDAPAHDRFPLKPGKTYGLMCLVPARSPNTETEQEKTVQSWPAALSRELLLFLLLLAALCLVAIYFHAPLEEPANPLHPPNPAKAPWYFLGLQEMVSYSAFWGGIGIPGLLVLLALVAPFLERKKGGEGVWMDHSRAAANWTFLILMGVLGFLTLIGSVFRGENWALMVPW
ncbi:MAG TPA: cytochrome b N-terminal domain-containing protein [Anaeromyxobacter sp.]|nr:cytochrome b N-terminal domain-containing protein [Anaeromyxobacter sp.]